MPLCTALKDRDNSSTPITQSNNIVDISGVGLKQFWNLRGHMQDASTLATAHYPETLDRIFIIGAPIFFPTVWGWIKKWFDPITTSKIFILGHHEMKKTLETFIDPANIPKKYGGQLDFEFGDHAVLDPALKNVLKWEGENNDFVPGPMYWVDEEGRGESGSGTGEMRAIAAGSSNKEERKVTVCTIFKSPAEASTAANGHAVGSQGNGKATEGGSESTDATFATAGTGAAAVAMAESPKAETETPKEPEATHVVEGGKLVPASRPEPVSFHTAPEGLSQLSLSEKSEHVVPSEGPHSITTANLSDPNVNLDNGATAALVSPVSKEGEIASEKVPEKEESKGLLGEVAENVGL